MRQLPERSALLGRKVENQLSPNRFHLPEIATIFAPKYRGMLERGTQANHYGSYESKKRIGN